MTTSQSQPCAEKGPQPSSPQPLRVLSLFAGIGGFDLGLERTGGFKTVRVVEKEPYCQRVLAKHFPEATQTGDVTAADFEEGEADVIVGGFPCQDVSNAGRRAGLSGSRSGLYRHLVRAIRVVRPAVAIVENVAALLSRGLGTVLGDLAQSGYDTEWDCIPASAVGAPHQRDRVWIVAHPRGKQHEGKGDAFRRALAAGLPEALERNAGLPVGPHGEAHAQRANADGVRSHRADIDEQGDLELRDEQDGVAGPMGGAMAYAHSPSGPQPKPDELGRGWSSYGPPRSARPGRRGDGIWAVEPDVGRVAHGVPGRVDRLRALGNAVVPQIPELLGEAILAAEAQRLAA